jgi:hypothetical protein
MKKMIIVEGCYYCNCIKPIVGGLCCDANELYDKEGVDRKQLDSKKVRRNAKYMPDWCPLDDYESD